MITAVFMTLCFFGWQRAARADGEDRGTAFMVGVLMVLAGLGIALIANLGVVLALRLLL